MLSQLFLQDLRLFESLQIYPQPGINVIWGSNGTGKTTLLEAIYLLARGRSFRHREASPLIRQGERQFTLRAHFNEPNGQAHVLGMRRGSGQDVEVRLDARAVRKRSEILNLLPVQVIGPDPQHLLNGPPEGRRAFLDAGLFHVEHNYLSVLASYNRLLDQRNAHLRSQLGPSAAWDEQLSFHGEEVDRLRNAYCSQLFERFENLVDTFQLGFGLDITYRRGWPRGVGLLEHLDRTRSTDNKLCFTGSGPHRADLVVRVAQQRSGRRLSRGQQKLLACSLLFAQSTLTRELGDKREILLFDDMPAELDSGNRERLMTHVERSFPQSFISALSLSDLPTLPVPATMFHVEHSQVVRVG